MEIIRTVEGFSSQLFLFYVTPRKKITKASEETTSTLCNLIEMESNPVSVVMSAHRRIHTCIFRDLYIDNSFHKIFFNEHKIFSIRYCIYTCKENVFLF